MAFVSNTRDGASHFGATRTGIQYFSTRFNGIWKALRQNHLWNRMVKNVLTTTITISLCLINEPNSTFGKAAYLGAMMTVFAHPGRRLGQLMEALTLALAGAIVGVAWSVFGIYLSSLLMTTNQPAAYAVRGIFLTVGLMLHGFLRSQSPRLWTFVLLLVIVCLIGFTTTATQITPTFVTQLLYPILLATGVILTVNICIFPEFSSRFLGEITIKTLSDITKTLNDAGHYFVRAENPKNGGAAAVNQCHQFSHNGTPGATEEESPVSLSDITAAKSALRTKVSSCTAAQNECQFELAYSVLPPRSMGSISKGAMSKLLTNTIAVIGACESRFSLLGDPANDTAKHTPKEDIKDPSLRDDPQLELIKPKREIEYGDVHVLRHLVDRIRKPYEELDTALRSAVNVVSECLAFTYDVPKLPSGAKAPKGILLEEVDQHYEAFQLALRRFDIDTTAALEHITALNNRTAGEEPDILPRVEIFLISSFLLNFRQAATQISDMLNSSRELVDKRIRTRGMRRLYAPKIRWRRWLSSGGEEIEALPTAGWKAARHDEFDDHASGTVGSNKNGIEYEKARTVPQDIEAAGNNEMREEQSSIEYGSSPDQVISTQDLLPLSLRLRGQLADIIEWIQSSEDFIYASKLTAAVFLVTWPALVPSLNQWYSLNRGVWAALQLVFVFEVAIGTSIMTFFLRAIGTTLGSLWGWAAYEARSSNPVVCTTMLFVGLIPAVYVQLGSKYPKAGMVSIVSMCVVALSTELQTVPGSGTENFLKRWIAFLIGGTLALLVELMLLPVKARGRMIESLAAAIQKIAEMEGCIAYGIEDGVNMKAFPPEVFLRFSNASSKAKTALSAAGTFLPFCYSEPRLKGPFSGLGKIYTEILFVLHQIVDKMDNLLQLRTVYGSGPLEDFNALIYPYRRNIAGCITLSLYAVQEALTTKLPLPQFLPSARLAHLRLINRVRQVVRSRAQEDDNNQNGQQITKQRALRWISWNASAAAQAEVIEYLEELADLAKLLVGANEFRSGLLTRPTYKEYIAASKKNDDSEVERPAGMGSDGAGIIEKTKSPTVHVREEQDLPISLRRIQTRKYDEEVRRRRTNESQ